MKKKQAILAITVGILLLGFIPTAAASGKVTKRSLADWLVPNYSNFPWGEQNWAFADYGDPANNLVCKMGLPWPKSGLLWAPWFINDMVYENGLVDGDTIIDGKITERVLNDGKALITLHLDVKNAPLTVYDFDEFILYCFGVTVVEPQAVLGSGIDGYMDYKVVAKFIIPEPGADLPDTFDIWYNYISISISGTGFGTLTERAVELGFAETAGAMGRVRLHQIALFKPDFKVDHPKYDASYGDFWPVENIEIFEMS